MIYFNFLLTIIKMMMN